MLSDVNAALRQLLHDRGLIDPRDVDVEFDTPVKSWVNARARPTLDFFLFQVEENTELRRTAMETSRANGRGVHRMPPRRFDLRYLVSAITTEVADEHLMLWRALVTLMKYPTLPDEVLPEALRGLEPPLVTKVDKPDEGPRILDLWGALETPPRPALLYTVTIPVDLEIAIESPLVLTRTTRYHRVALDGVPVEAAVQIGGVVLDKKRRRLAGARVSVEGRAAEPVVTNEEGEFMLASVPAGAVTLRVVHAAKPAKLVKIQVPSDTYEVVVE